MNYYAGGGQAHGIKSLAQELPKYGRYGDTMVAHINPEEAAVLKAMGGSGTINPITGLPEYNFFKSVKNVVAAPFRLVNEGIKAIPGIGPAFDKALVGLDKGIGSLVPGGWGTIASIAGSAAGLPTWAMTGMGALTGSGALKKDGKFNLQGALMGGAMAYGMSQLGEAARAAEGVNTGYDPSSGLTSAADATAYTSSGDFTAGLAGQAPQVNPNVVSPEIFRAAQSNIDPSVLEGMSREAVSAAKVLPTTPNVAPSYFDARMADLKSTGQGLANLSGFAGPEGTAAAARAAAVGPITRGGMTALAMGTMGTMQIAEQEKYLQDQLSQGTIDQTEYNTQMATIEAARKRGEDAVRANPYQFAMGGEVDGEEGADDNPTNKISGYAMGGIIGASNSAYPATSIAGGIGGSSMPGFEYPNTTNPLSGNPISTVVGDTFQPVGPRQTGNIQDALAGLRSLMQGSQTVTGTPQPLFPQVADDSNINPNTGGESMSGGQQSNGNAGIYGGGSALGGGGGGGGPFPLAGQYGIVKMAMGGAVPGYAGGRFLSGEGDGLSDDIHATIEGKQPAKLADGEFVVSSDVVSNLGNGSSKAGAKKLYAMMDRVRQQAHGTKKQIRKVNANKVLPA